MLPEMTPQGITPPESPEQTHALGLVRGRQNLGAALLAGAVVAAVCAVAWAGISVALERQIGFMAIGVGLAVGFAVQKAGRGIDAIYGWIGGGFSLAGCAVGNLLMTCMFVARQENVELSQVLGNLNLDTAAQLMQATAEPMDLVFYGIAAWEGFRLARLKLVASV
jgi:hypothetical protein